MNGIPVSVERIIQKLQQLPGGAVLWELAMTQVALDDAMKMIEESKNGSRPVEPASVDERVVRAQG